MVSRPKFPASNWEKLLYTKSYYGNMLRDLVRLRSNLCATLTEWQIDGKHIPCRLDVLQL